MIMYIKIFKWMHIIWIYFVSRPIQRLLAWHYINKIEYDWLLLLLLCIYWDTWMGSAEIQLVVSTTLRRYTTSNIYIEQTEYI